MCRGATRSNASNRPVEVLDCGVNGYSPIQELLLLRREGPRYRPDLVMVNLFLDNDVSGSSPVSEYHRRPVTVRRTRRRQAGIRFLPSRTIISRLSSGADLSHPKVFGDVSMVSDNEPASGRCRCLQNPHSTHVVRRIPCPPIWEEAWSVLERVLLELAAESDRLGARLLIVSLPCALGCGSKKLGEC